LGDLFTQYPSKVEKNFYGNCLIAAKDISKGTIVEHFEGPIVSRRKIPREEICYALLIDNDRWILPKTNARFLNHSCNPNCKINDVYNVITTRTIKFNEELTISYNIVYERENPGDWDPHWTFECKCGSKNCQGLVNKYITPDGKPWISENLFDNLKEFVPLMAVSKSKS
jgi:hypothetical protein